MTPTDPQAALIAAIQNVQAAQAAYQAGVAQLTTDQQAAAPYDYAVSTDQANVLSLAQAYDDSITALIAAAQAAEIPLNTATPVANFKKGH